MIVLLTGISGAGKTAALHELAARGYAVQDLDYDGYSYLAEDPRKHVGWEQLWDLDKVRGLLDTHADDTLFVAGTVYNQCELYDRFGAVVLLTAPSMVLLDRVATRSGNPYGKDAAGRAQIAHDIEEVEPFLGGGATHVVATDRPRRKPWTTWSASPKVPLGSSTPGRDSVMEKQGEE